MDAAYTDKLDGTITPQLWQHMQAEWQAEEIRIKSLIAGLGEDRSGERLLNMKRILELAQNSYYLYLTRKSAERAEMLRNVLLNCSIDAVSLYPTYRKPFDLICKRAKCNEWSGRRDSNPRPSAPKADALPGCATPRHSSIVARIGLPLGADRRALMSKEPGQKPHHQYDGNGEDQSQSRKQSQQECPVPPGVAARLSEMADE